jgi:hypothetical protein
MKKTNKIIFFALLAAVSLIVNSCSTDILWDRRLSEGVIEFAVSYPEMDPNDVMLDFLPNTMTMKFKDNKFTTELSAGMGMFKTKFISDCINKKLIQAVKLINKQYYTEYDEEGVKRLNKDYSDFHIIDVPGIKEVAGYHCQQKLIMFNEVGHESFYLYYTEDIKIENANWSFPFSEIPGVPLKYRIERNGIVMEFLALKVLEEKVDETTAFQVEEGYEKISNEKMEKELDAVFESITF